MAYDQVVDSAVLDDGLAQIANAIREKAGTENTLIFPREFVEAISGLETGGLNLEISSFTLKADTTFHTFTHNLGKVPSLIVLVPRDLYKQAGSTPHVLLAAVYIAGYFYGAYTIDEGIMSSGGLHDVTGPNYVYDGVSFLTAPFLENVTDREITFNGSSSRTVYLAGDTEYVCHVG